MVYFKRQTRSKQNKYHDTLLGPHIIVSKFVYNCYVSNYINARIVYYALKRLFWFNLTVHCYTVLPGR